VKRPNHVWDEAARCFRYPSGDISVTEQGMYASIDSMREWSAVGLCAAIAWMIWGEQRWFTKRGECDER
jgi:hypothetical protein